MKRLLLVGLVTAACGTDTAVEKYRTLSDGVYGLAAGGCDTFPCAGGASPAAAMTLRLPDGGVVASTSTDFNGFYELTADAGTYSLCIYTATICTTVTFDGGIQRIDHTSGPGGGSWRAVPVPSP